MKEIFSVNEPQILEQERLIYENGVLIDCSVYTIHTVLLFEMNNRYKEIIINNSTEDAIRVNTFRSKMEYQRMREI
jgi:hypothetical protein